MARDDALFLLLVLTRASCLDLVPSFKESDVTFYYFGRESPDFVQVRAKSVTDVVTRGSKVSFIVHGFTENRTTAWYEPLTRALQSRGYAVIQVDYARAGQQLYPLAVLDAPKVAEAICRMVVALTKAVPLQKIHLVGHSLGGQIIGHVGGCFQKKTGKKLPMLKALDPAGPLFEYLSISGRRLSPADAEVVFAIHTDMYMFGHKGIKGQVDVFPNGGGALQPGCPNSRDNTIYCSHHMSYWYYIQAVQYPGSLFALKCSSYAAYKAGLCNASKMIDIGSDTFSNEDKGQYYLRTKEREPYRLDP